MNKLFYYFNEFDLKILIVTENERKLERKYKHN